MCRIDIPLFFLYYVILGVGKWVAKQVLSTVAVIVLVIVPFQITGKETMADQTSNEISHVQSVNRGRESQRNKIKTNLSKETQAVLQKNTEELGVDKVKKQISLFFTTPIDKINKL